MQEIRDCIYSLRFLLILTNMLCRIYELEPWTALYLPIVAALPAAPSSSVCNHVLGVCFSSSSSAGSACPLILIFIGAVVMVVALLGRHFRSRHCCCCRSAVFLTAHASCGHCVIWEFWHTQAHSPSAFLAAAVRLFFLAPLANIGRNGLNFLATAA